MQANSSKWVNNNKHNNKHNNKLLMLGLVQSVVHKQLANSAQSVANRNLKLQLVGNVQTVEQWLLVNSAQNAVLRDQMAKRNIDVINVVGNQNQVKKYLSSVQNAATQLTN